MEGIGSAGVYGVWDRTCTICYAYENNTSRPLRSKQENKEEKIFCQKISQVFWNTIVQHKEEEAMGHASVSIEWGRHWQHGPQ